MKNTFITLIILLSSIATTQTFAMNQRNNFDNILLKSNFVVSEGYKKAVLQDMHAIDYIDNSQEIDIVNFENHVIEEYIKTDKFVEKAVNDPRVQKRMAVTKICETIQVIGLSAFMTTLFLGIGYLYFNHNHKKNLISLEFAKATFRANPAANIKMQHLD